jgi:hypothetical protein
MVGATGMGGGSLMTPLLILVFGIKPVLAIGTDLAYGAVTKTLGGWRHLRQGTVDLRISAWLAVGSIPGALVGVWLLDWLERALHQSFDSTILGLVAGALLMAGTLLFGRALFMRRVAERERTTIDLQARHKAALVVLGVVVGFVLGITSAGSGALIGIGLIIAFRLTPRRVVGTDVFHAAVLLWVASLAHLASGNVDLGLAANILIGSLPGVLIGARVAMRAPEGALRTALGIVLLASGVALLAKAGVAVPTAVLVVVPAGLTAFAVGLHVHRARRARAAASEALAGAGRERRREVPAQA